MVFRFRPALTDKVMPALMRSVFVPRGSWILSGSLMGWGDALIENVDAVVFLSVDRSIRMERLERREAVRYGEVDEAAQRAFFDWARGYDDPDFHGRSRVRHDRWLAALPCPVLPLDGADPVPRLVDSVTTWLDSPAVNG